MVPTTFEIPPSDRHEAFGKVSVTRCPDGSMDIKAYILIGSSIEEGMQTGIAIDGSGSMKDAFGGTGGALSSLFKTKPNLVLPVAQTICHYLASDVDADGGTTVIYWATGTGGLQIEVIGDLTAEQAKTYNFGGPKHYGTGTRLKPAMKYFVDRFADAPSAIYIFITDGILDDLDEVKQYTRELAKDIEAGRRNKLKFVIIGLGKDIDEAQMIELDDLETGTKQDLWLHRLASDMNSVAEIFVESINASMIVSDNAVIRDGSGKLIQDFRDRGLPALIEFSLPPGSKYFTIEVDGNTVDQRIS